MSLSTRRRIGRLFFLKSKKNLAQPLSGVIEDNAAPAENCSLCVESIQDENFPDKHNHEIAVPREEEDKSATAEALPDSAVVTLAVPLSEPFAEVSKEPLPNTETSGVKQSDIQHQNGPFLSHAERVDEAGLPSIDIGEPLLIDFDEPTVRRPDSRATSHLQDSLHNELKVCKLPEPDIVTEVVTLTGKQGSVNEESQWSPQTVQYPIPDMSLGDMNVALDRILKALPVSHHFSIADPFTKLSAYTLARIAGQFTTVGPYNLYDSVIIKASSSIFKAYKVGIMDQVFVLPET
jgi:hypothetical protein